MSMNNDQLLTTREVAKLLNIRNQSLINWRCRGKGPTYVRLGDSPKAAVRYRMSDITEFMKEGK